VEVTDSDKHSSLLRQGRNYIRKKFYGTGSRIAISNQSKLISALENVFGTQWSQLGCEGKTMFDTVFKV